MTSALRYATQFNTRIFGKPAQRWLPSAVIESMPGEVLLEIAEHLPTKADCLHLGMTSTTLFPKVIASLYVDVELEGFERCRDTLAMLCNNPDIARHVRSLAVYPDWLPDHQPAGYEPSREWCGVVSGLVARAAKHMDALHAFTWNALAAGPDESMWTELRRCCPNLKNLATSFVHIPPSPMSDLFLFQDLKSFKLLIRSTFYLANYDFEDMEYAFIYSRLCNMLTRRCPNLEALTIQGEWDEPLYASRLFEGTWPKLKSLSLTPVKLASETDLSTERLFNFLERHSAIEELTLIHMIHIDLSHLSPESLPNLRVFNGSLDHLKELSLRGHAPNQLGLHPQHGHLATSSLAKTLESYSFTDPLPLRELTPMAISTMLVGLRSLTSLTLKFHLESGYDSNGVFRSIVSACPQLLHLDLSCTFKPSVYLEAFSRTLRNLTKLRTLSLALVKVPGEESMQACATRLALSNPRLDRYTLTFLPANRMIRRPYAPPRILAQGRYIPVRDVHGIPITLLARESWYRFGGYGAKMVRQATYELRQSGHPDAMRKGWGQLLIDKSPAGEEARMLVFSAWLMILAVWGVARGVAWNVVDAPWRARGLDTVRGDA